MLNFKNDLLLKVFRKPFVNIVLLTVFTFTSCSRNDTMEYFDTNFKNSKLDLKAKHLEIKQSFEDKNRLVLFGENTNNEMQQIFDKNFIENLKYVNENGLDKLFQSENINVKWIDAVEYIYTNENSGTLYQDLLKMNIIETEEEVQLFFSYYEIYRECQSLIANVSEEGYMEMGLPPRCGRAVAGTILATAVFAGVTAATGGFGTAAAVGFLVSKSWATYNVISACSQ